MRTVHLLRKYNPAEWGGTETAIQRLFEGLRRRDVTNVVFFPRINGNGIPANDPLLQVGCRMERFTAFVPISVQLSLFLVQYAMIRHAVARTIRSRTMIAV